MPGIEPAIASATATAMTAAPTRYHNKIHINFIFYGQVFIHSPEEVTTSTTSSFGVDVEGIIEFGLSVWSSRISDALRYMPRFLRKCR